MHLVIKPNATAQRVLSVIKPHQLYPKDQSQHVADLYMMSRMEEFKADTN